MNKYEALLDAQKSVEERDALAKSGSIYIPPGPRLGDVVIEADHLTKAFGDRLLIDDLNFMIPPGAIVGVIGPNGAGKSTLLSMMTGKQDPDSGSMKVALWWLVFGLQERTAMAREHRRREVLCALIAERGDHAPEEYDRISKRCGLSPAVDFSGA